jgi:3-hydroxyisobutyrate dehydrogenase-like beta-hydroxyacid dehydrogenase
MKVGFLGLGQMGAGMAANLVKAGHEVTVYNRSFDKTGPLAELGAKAAKTVDEACHGEAIITMVADDKALEGMIFGDAGALANLPKNAIHISSSTIGVALSERLLEAHAQAGQRFVSAPVFGRPEAAAAAKLFVVAAGETPTLAECAPLFDAIGQRTFIISDQAGVDQHAYLDMLTSTLFSAAVYKTYGGLIAGGVFEPAGFAAPLGQKDIRLTLAAAETLSVPMPIASLLRDRFLSLIAQGGETLDWSAIGKLAARDSGQ